MNQFLWWLRRTENTTRRSVRRFAPPHKCRQATFYFSCSLTCMMREALTSTFDRASMRDLAVASFNQERPVAVFVDRRNVSFQTSNQNMLFTLPVWSAYFSCHSEEMKNGASALLLLSSVGVVLVSRCVQPFQLLHPTLECRRETDVPRTRGCGLLTHHILHLPPCSAASLAAAAPNQGVRMMLFFGLIESREIGIRCGVRFRRGDTAMVKY